MSCTNPYKPEFNRSLTVLSQSGWRRLIDRRNARRALFFLTGVNDHLFSSFRFPCRAICLKSHDTRKKERVASLLKKPTDKWPHLWQLVVWLIEGRAIYGKEKRNIGRNYLISHYRDQRNRKCRFCKCLIISEPSVFNRICITSAVLTRKRARLVELVIIRPT